MKFKELAPGIVHISLPTRREIASALIRFQEHYESPNPEIRGKIFTLGYLRSKGRSGEGLHTYEGGHNFTSDWSGYNFPSTIVEPFIRGMFDPLTSYEQDIVNVLRCKQGSYYIIGTSEESEDSELMTALDHEICHALYFVNPKYKKEVDTVLAQYDTRNLKKAIQSMGYAEEVLQDEAHAYMSADYDHFFTKFSDLAAKYKVVVPKELHLKLRKIKAKHFKEGV